MRSVLWQDPAQPGSEQCWLLADGVGWRVGGTALLVADGGPVEARYDVRLSDAWHTRSVTVERVGAGAVPGAVARVETRVEPGAVWFVDGQRQPDLDGCLDVDIEFTPATNTLPIRRLALDTGASRDITVAWVRFPGLTVEPATQRYTRLAAATYRFETGSFAAELDVDDVGLVRRYGDFWRQVAHADG